MVGFSRISVTKIYLVVTPNSFIDPLQDFLERIYLVPYLSESTLRESRNRPESLESIPDPSPPSQMEKETDPSNQKHEKHKPSGKVRKKDKLQKPEIQGKKKRKEKQERLTSRKNRQKRK